MNSNLSVPGTNPWPVAPSDPAPARPMMPGQRDYSPTAILDLPTLMRIVQDWRWLIIGTIAAGLALALLKTLLTPPTYRAGVTLEANPPTVTVSEEDSRQREGGMNNYEFLVTQVGLLSSRAVAQRTAEELNLANNPEFAPQDADAATRLRAATGAVAGGLRVVPPEEGNLIHFTVESPSAQYAALIANGVADAFINTALQRRYEASAYARNFLERQIAKTRSDLEASEKSLVGYQQRQGIINTGGAAAGSTSDTNSLQGESLIALNQALAQATARRVAAEGAYRQTVAVGETVDVAQSTSGLRAQRATLEADYQQKRTFMKPDHPEMLSLRSQIDELSKQISRETAQISSGKTNSLLADYRSALAAERALQARVGGLKGQVLNMRGRSIQYNILQREVDTNRSLYDALLQRYKEIGVAGGVGVAPVSIVDRAEPPGGPFKPNLMLNLLIGLGLGALAGIGGAIGLEFLNDTIKTREDVRRKLGLACLGVIPRVPGKTDFIAELDDPKSFVAEAYSTVVAALRYSSDKGTPKQIFVTSTQQSEGKSSTALALAENFSRRGSRVLLIDADLRKPAFKASNEAIGLSKLLTSEEAAAQHIVRTQYDNLSLLPSGPVPPNPADLLSTARLAAVLQEVGQAHDLVIIDGPPTLGLADPPLLAAATGNVLFVVEAGKTRTRAAIEAINRLEATGVHMLGVVLSKAGEGAGHHYGYGYGYGTGKIADHQSAILMIPHDKG